MNPPPARPRLLLVEDDAVSREFLWAAAEALPADVDAVDTISAAIACAARNVHALWLIDANLPDGRGEMLLQALRDAGITTPALAHTAAQDPGMQGRMRALGFVGMLQKPLGVGELHDSLREHLPAIGMQPRSGGKLPAWDDASALAALGGQRPHVD
ncbi:MAG: response regulator, partial [Pseudomonadota bacterium]|nr:response regulator [Pseudomonadota bacterium]